MSDKPFDPNNKIRMVDFGTNKYSSEKFAREVGELRITEEGEQRTVKPHEVKEVVKGHVKSGERLGHVKKTLRDEMGIQGTDKNLKKRNSVLKVLNGEEEK